MDEREELKALRRLAELEAKAGLSSSEGMPQLGMRTSRVASEAPFKALAGAADVFLEAPLNVYNLGKAAFGTGATALGRPDLAPDVTPSPNMVYRLGQRAGIISPEETQAQMTPAQRYLDVGLQGATGALIGKTPTPGTVAKMMGINAASAMGGQGVTELTGSPTAGFMFTPLAGAGLTAGGNAFANRQMAARGREIAQQLQNAEQNSVMLNTLGTAQKEGFAIPQSYYTPGKAPGFAERAAGGIEKDISLINQVKANEVTRKALKLEKNAPLTDETMGAIREQEYKSGYKPVESIGKVYVDKKFQDDLNEIKNKIGSASNSFPKATRNEVMDLVNKHDELSFNTRDTMKRIQALRDDASDSFKNGNTGLSKAQKAIANALEDRIDRKLLEAGPAQESLLQNFRESRKRMAMSHAVQDALVPGTGSVDASQLAAQLKQGLTGGLKTIGELASAAPNLFPARGNVGAMQPQTQTGIPFGKAANVLARVVPSVAGGQYMGGIPGAVGGAALAAGPELVSAIARNRAIAASRNAPQPLNALNIPMMDQNMLNQLMTVMPVGRQPFESY